MNNLLYGFINPCNEIKFFYSLIMKEFFMEFKYINIKIINMMFNS